MHDFCRKYLEGHSVKGNEKRIREDNININVDYED
jgi:hypothetical protein